MSPTVGRALRTINLTTAVTVSWAIAAFALSSVPRAQVVTDDLAMNAAHRLGTQVTVCRDVCVIERPGLNGQKGEWLALTTSDGSDDERPPVAWPCWPFPKWGSGKSNPKVTRTTNTSHPADQMRYPSDAAIAAVKSYDGEIGTGWSCRDETQHQEANCKSQTHL